VKEGEKSRRFINVPVDATARTTLEGHESSKKNPAARVN